MEILLYYFWIFLVLNFCHTKVDDNDYYYVGFSIDVEDLVDELPYMTDVNDRIYFSWYNSVECQDHIDNVYNGMSILTHFNEEYIYDDGNYIKSWCYLLTFYTIYPKLSHVIINDDKLFDIFYNHCILLNSHTPLPDNMLYNGQIFTFIDISQQDIYLFEKWSRLCPCPLYLNRNTSPNNHTSNSIHNNTKPTKVVVEDKLKSRCPFGFSDNVNDQSTVGLADSSPPEVTSTVGLADSSSNSLPVNGNATPGDRGDVVEDKPKSRCPFGFSDVVNDNKTNPDHAAEFMQWFSSEFPAADLREAEGQVNKESHHGEWKQNVDRTSGEKGESSKNPSHSSFGYSDVVNDNKTNPDHAAEFMQWFSSEFPAADLWEAKGQLNRESRLQDKDRTSGGKPIGNRDDVVLTNDHSNYVSDRLNYHNDFLDYDWVPNSTVDDSYRWSYIYFPKLAEHEFQFHELSKKLILKLISNGKIDKLHDINYILLNNVQNFIIKFIIGNLYIKNNKIYGNINVGCYINVNHSIVESVKNKFRFFMSTSIYKNFINNVINDDNDDRNMIEYNNIKGLGQHRSVDINVKLHLSTTKFKLNDKIRIKLTHMLDNSIYLDPYELGNIYKIIKNEDEIFTKDPTNNTKHYNDIGHGVTTEEVVSNKASAEDKPKSRCPFGFSDVNDQSTVGLADSSPPEVTSTVGLADSSSNSLPVNGNATPGDRGDVVEDKPKSRCPFGFSANVDDNELVNQFFAEFMRWGPDGPQVKPAADLREAKGEVNKESHRGEWKDNVDRTSGGPPGADLWEAKGQLNREADGRIVTSGQKAESTNDPSLSPFGYSDNVNNKTNPDHAAEFMQWFSSEFPAADLWEAKGQLNNEADGRNVTSGGSASGTEVETNDKTSGEKADAIKKPSRCPFGFSSDNVNDNKTNTENHNEHNIMGQHGDNKPHKENNPHITPPVSDNTNTSYGKDSLDRCTFGLSYLLLPFVNIEDHVIDSSSIIYNGYVILDNNVLDKCEYITISYRLPFHTRYTHMYKSNDKEVSKLIKNPRSYDYTLISQPLVYIYKNVNPITVHNYFTPYLNFLKEITFKTNDSSNNTIAYNNNNKWKRIYINKFVNELESLNCKQFNRLGLAYVTNNFIFKGYNITDTQHYLALSVPIANQNDYNLVITVTAFTISLIIALSVTETIKYLKRIQKVKSN